MSRSNDDVQHFWRDLITHKELYSFAITMKIYTIWRRKFFKPNNIEAYSTIEVFIEVI